VKNATLVKIVDKEKPFGFYENVSLVSPSMGSCQCGIGSGCGGGGSSGNCQCGIGSACGGGGSGGSCQCGIGSACSGSG
jgi:hypothetical protein